MLNRYREWHRLLFTKMLAILQNYRVLFCERSNFIIFRAEVSIQDENYLGTFVFKIVSYIYTYR